MSSPVVRKAKKEDDDIIDMDKVAKDTKGFIEKVLGDVSTSSASKQLVMGTASGWVTGFITMKVGKMAAVAVGGGIILLQIANSKGYIKINWDKVYKQVDKVADKVEEQATGQGPNWMDKIKNFRGSIFRKSVSRNSAVGSFARENTCLAAGFVGGFFLGIASS